MPLSDICYTNQTWWDEGSLILGYSYYIVDAVDVGNHGLGDVTISQKGSSAALWAACLDPSTQVWGFESNSYAEWVEPTTSGTRQLVASGASFGGAQSWAASLDNTNGIGYDLVSAWDQRWVQVLDAGTVEPTLVAINQSRMNWPFCQTTGDPYWANNC